MRRGFLDEAWRRAERLASVGLKSFMPEPASRPKAEQTQLCVPAPYRRLAFPSPRFSGNPLQPEKDLLGSRSSHPNNSGFGGYPVFEPQVARVCAREAPGDADAGPGACPRDPWASALGFWRWGLRASLRSPAEDQPALPSVRRGLQLLGFPGAQCHQRDPATQAPQLATSRREKLVSGTSMSSMDWPAIPSPWP